MTLTWETTLLSIPRPPGPVRVQPASQQAIAWGRTVHPIPGHGGWLRTEPKASPRLALELLKVASSLLCRFSAGK